jgi:tetratricopeptide (TPR) repeat protein
MLEAIDTEKLSSREKFFVEHLLARYSEDREEDPDELVTRYLAQNPADPYVLDEHCNWLWLSGDREEEAFQCYQKLLSVEPNWVTAQNRLGYLAMSQGRFELAEGFFLTYRFVAPDQANPHDSLAELLLLRGRYDEAHQELEEALTLREDFCASSLNLVRLAFLSNQDAIAEDAVERAERHCGEALGEELRCRTDFHRQMHDGDWVALAQRWEDPCVQKAPSLRWMIHRAAVMTGQLKLAKAVEKAIQRQIRSHLHQDMETTSLLLHLTAVRLVSQGDPVSAVELFRDADERLGYQNLGNGSLKLFNRLNWSYAAALAGDEETSDRLVSEVAEVNPALAALFLEGGLAMPSPELADARD